VRETRKLHDEGLRDLQCPSNITQVTKAKRMKWAAHQACVEDNRYVYRVLVGKLQGK
jgi:hypothetical protein